MNNLYVVFDLWIRLAEFFGALFVLGALAVGTVGTPILCLAVGAWRSSDLAHVKIGWGIAVGFGIGIGALLTNIVVAVFAFQALVDAAPVVSGDWSALYAVLVCPYLTAPLAIAATWMIYNIKGQREQAAQERIAK